ncbi:MAG: hypothetical protein AB7V00_05045 [Bacilli bacterium]
MNSPEKQSKLALKIAKLWETNDLKTIYSLRHEVINNLEENNKQIDDVFMAGFVLKEFRNNFIFGQQLLAKNYESMAMLYYLLLSCIGDHNLFAALAIIKNSQILNEKEYQEFHNWENANYAHLLTLPATDIFTSLVVLVMVYCEGLGRELNFADSQNDHILLVRWFDQINMLYEIGYPEEIIDELQKVSSIIFTIEEN